MKRLTVTDLEAMTPHDLAGLVLVLRRLPDVAMKDLQPIERSIDADALVAGVRHDEKVQNRIRATFRPGSQKKRTSFQSSTYQGVTSPG